MKHSIKTVLSLVCIATVGAAGFYAGRSTATSADKATPAKPHLASNTGGIHLNTDQAAATRATVEEFLKGKGKPDAAKLAEWAKTLSPAECAAYLSDLQNLPPGLQRDSVLQAVIGSWADKDPQGFLATTKNVTGPQMREQGVDAAIKSWAGKNPQEALQWLKDNPGNAPTSAIQARYVSAISGFAAADPQGAFATVAALEEGTMADQRLKNQAMQAVMGSLADQGKFTDANTLIATLPDNSPAKNQAYASLANSWAQSNPQDASAWVSSLTDPQLRSNLGGQVASQWAATDPAAAAAWAAQMDAQASAGGTATGAGVTNYLLADTMRTWAAYDLDGPANYLNQLPASPDKDGAVATFALSAAQEDPAGAMNWVNTISDDQMRQRLAMATALQWSQSDPNGFQQFMTTSNVLTDEQKQMLSNIPPQIGLILSGGYGGGGNQPANANGIQARIQNFIINGGGASGIFAPGGNGARGGLGGLLGGFGQGNPPAASGTAPAAPVRNQNTGPTIIMSQRNRRGVTGG